MLLRASALDPGQCHRLCSPCPASEAQPQCNYIAELLEQRAQGEEGLQVHVAVYESAILGPPVEGDPNFSPILPFPAGVCEFIEGH